MIVALADPTTTYSIYPPATAPPIFSTAILTAPPSLTSKEEYNEIRVIHDLELRVLEK